MFCIFTSITFELGKNFQRNYLYSSIWMDVLVYTSTDKTMTNMDYKEKYEQALERASKLRVQNPFDTVGQMVEHIFPELKESEDEKIRKAIISILKGEIRYISIEDTNKYVAWLEKQAEKSAEPEWCHHKVDLSNCSEEYRKAYYDGWNNCNMQHSQCEAKSNDDDEKIRKALKQGFFEYGKSFTKFGGIKVGDIIAWLEKQREKPQGKSALESIKEERVNNQNCVKSADKIEPKFKGDWIVQENIGVYKVMEICESWYEVVDNKNNHYSIGFDKEYMCHLWTIEDASTGDVLVYETDEVEWIFIYREIIPADSVVPHDLLRYYFLLEGNYLNCNGVSAMITDDYELYLKPATKEQRELLFQKMKEAGYEWDAEKKELKKIESKTLDADEVIEWLKPYSVIDNNIINCFKKDFGL